MMKQIKKVKSFGIFNDFKWPLELGNFLKFNAIYGLNGSGKSTLAKLFKKLENKSMSEDFPDVEFSIELDDGTVLTEKNFKDNNLVVKVFNKHFIEENIKWGEQEAKAIIGIGKDSIKLTEELEETKNEINKLKAKKIEKSNTKDSLEKEIEKILRKESKDIKDNIGTIGEKNEFRFYDKGKLKNFLATYNKDVKDNLSTENIGKLKSSLNEKVKANITIKLDFSELKSLDDINEILERQVESKLVERWKEHQKWVEDGVKKHKDPESCETKQSCIFCNNRLSEDFWSQVTDHFSDALQQLKDDCDTQIDTLEELKIDLDLPAKDVFYDDISIKYEILKKEIEGGVKNINSEIESIIEKLVNKKEDAFKAHDKVEVLGQLEKLYLSLSGCITQFDTFKETHNKRSNDFEASIKSISEQLLKHRVYQICDDYKTKSKEFAKLETEVGREGFLTKNIFELSEKEEELENKINDYSVNVERFNQLLISFLGRNEIQIELEKNGEESKYVLKRGTSKAKNLSEGEKTAIAYIYFLTTFEEVNFDKKESILVFDDPISSLDSSFVFNAYTFIKDHSESAKQVFILTHNYSFMKMINKWLDKKNRNLKLMETDNENVTFEANEFVTSGAKKYSA